MPTKKLLSVTNLSKYFSVSGASLLRRERLYLHANEDITLDIYEGETLGVVGESGCGKSTLGRVLLQLYPQTAGETMYYGRTLEDMTPAYVGDTLTRLPKYRAAYQRALRRVEKLEAQCAEAVGETARASALSGRLQMARGEVRTALLHMVRIIGGFFAVEEGEGVTLLYELYCLNRKRNALLKRLGTQKQKVSDAEWKPRLEALEQSITEKQAQLDAIRACYADRSEFAEYEAMRDGGIDLARLRPSEMRSLRRELQIVFQDPYSSLDPRLTVGQIIEEGVITHGVYRRGSAELRQHVADTVEKCGLQNYMLSRYPHQFSGGQRQRISIARALAVRPRFVVCDECVSALDVSIQSQIINLLQDLKEKEKLTYLFISHDLSVVRYLSDRICVMYLGSVVELGDAQRVFEHPLHPYTEALLSSIPTTDADGAKKKRILLEGSIPSPIHPPSGCRFRTRCYMACDKCRREPPSLREIEQGHWAACHFR